MSAIETTRRYYHDSYLTSVRANVIEAVVGGDGPAVVLDSTCFYPASGGQPHDTGTLGPRRVIGVEVRDTDQAVLHLLDGPLDPGPVEGTIDWSRRFDHMQQHTGQHILSQAFLRTAGAATVGFHLGDSYVSIDLDGTALAAETIEQALTVANEVVTANASVRAWFPEAAELATIALRKTPDVDGALRIVAIGDFDISACGGTHVRRTGEVGAIHFLRAERLKRGTRISFLCGARARRDHADKQRITAALSAALTCSADELPGAVERLQTDLQETRRELTRYREIELDREAEALAARHAGDGPQVTMAAWTGRTVDDLKGLVLRLTSGPGVVALLATAGERTQFVFGRSEDVTTNLKPALDAALAIIGGGKGGGARIVQGGGAAVDLDTVEQALDAARQALGAAG